MWLGTSVVTRSYCYPKTVPNAADITRWNSMLIIVLRLSKTFRSSWSLYEVINCFSCLERNIFYLPDSKLFWVYSNTVDPLRKCIGIIVTELLQTASVSILVFHFCNQWWCKTINNMVKPGTLAKVQETPYVAITFNWLVYFKIGHRPKNPQSTKFIETLCAIWYCLYNLKYMANTMDGWYF